MMYTLAPAMSLVDPMHFGRGRTERMYPHYDLHDGFGVEDIVPRGSSNSVGLWKNDKVLKPLSDLSSTDPQFTESEDGKSYVLSLDLSDMDKHKDKVTVSASGKLISVKGAVEKEESWVSQGGGRSQSTSSASVTRSYSAPGPILGAELKSKWEDGKLIISVPKASAEQICADHVMDDEGDGHDGDLVPSIPNSGSRLLDTLNQMDTMLRPFGEDSIFCKQHAKLTEEEKKSIEEHHAKEKEAREKLRQAHKERLAKEAEIKAKREMIARRQRMHTEIQRDANNVNLSILFPEGTAARMCAMHAEEDRFGEQHLVVTLRNEDGEIQKERRFPLPEDMDTSNISAKFDDKESKLNIHLMQRKPKQISIDIMED